jgi:hypothetical protein
MDADLDYIVRLARRLKELDSLSPRHEAYLAFKQELERNYGESISELRKEAASLEAPKRQAPRA